MSTPCLGQGLDTGKYTSEFEKSWSEYLRALGNVEGCIQYKLIKNGKLEREFVNCLVASYPLVADVRGQFDAPIDVLVTGNRYNFSMNRTDPADGWRVEHISTGDPGNDLSWSFPEHFADPPSHVTNPNGYKIFNTIGVGLFGMGSNPNLPYMIASEWVSIHEISLVEKNNSQQLLMLFDYKRVYKKNSYSLKGKVFLTTDSFLITEGEFHLESIDGVEHVQVRIDYDNVTYRVPLPKNYYKKETYKLVIDGECYEGTIESEQVFDLKETDPKSFERFTLSGYGLPEPDFDEPKTDWFRNTLVIISVLLIAIALWRMWRNRKEA